MYLREEATKKSLTNKPIKGNILHFATHGFYFATDEENQFGMDTVGRRQSDRNPLWRSGLALAGANIDRTDGILYAAEVLYMDLSNFDVVVLSACDTGSGFYSSAEGVIGLTRAFLISGAGSVVSSKWPVSSSETVKFMEIFYGLLSKGFPVSQALQKTRIQIKKIDPNPYIWGAFTINKSGI